MDYPSALHPGLASAPPHWRWELAKLLAGNPTGRPARNDATIHAAADYVRARSRGVTLAGDQPLATAAAVYEADGRPRWHLEALILAGLPVGDVADRVELAPGVVAAYEAVFFDVRSKLHAASWIAAHTFGMGPVTGFAPGDLGGLWRWVGYRRGADAFDLVRAVTTGVGRDRYTAADLEAAELFVLTARLRPGEDSRRLLQLNLRLQAEAAGKTPAAYHLPRRSGSATGRAAKG